MWPFSRSVLSPEDQAAAEEVERLTNAWERACLGAGLIRRIETVSGPTLIPPRVTFVNLGPPDRLTVRLEPGMVADDLRSLAPRLAPHLGAYGLRIEPRGRGEWCIVTLLYDDPLDGVLSLPEGPLSGPVLIGTDEQGQDVTADPADLGHIAVQGATGSGKSAFLYALLSQLTDREHVEITGVDPSGILLRPLAEPRSSEHHSVSAPRPFHRSGPLLGLSDPEIIADYTHRLVEDMDQRVRRIPRDRDSLPESEGLRFLVFEEYPGLLRYLDAADIKIGKRVRAYVARLLAEGRKAGIRVILVAQRAEASVIGSTERGQCSTRVSFRVDNIDAVRLLHPDADPDTAAAHASAVPGVALVSSPGRPLTRVRSPWIGGYSEYVRRVAA
ncbi:FtsK/SpoIIIE domain-containing protein [Pseudonocardia sp. NPDC046786]|uniref:FtsK/SpoIIIE domain-containing protein n=1 Tax=Pseudonocardia sp. NPDC046786 TaxID=3155471 RepID=UPI0033FE1ED0